MSSPLGSRSTQQIHGVVDENLNLVTFSPWTKFVKQGEGVTEKGRAASIRGGLVEQGLEVGCNRLSGTGHAILFRA